jgi:glycosyltransferase involved in cell wall biosynthesis
MSQYFEVVGISSPGVLLQKVEKEEGIRTYGVNMSRSITPFRDLLALAKLIRIFKKEHPEFVHTHTAKAGILGMLAAWICNVPVRLHTVAGLPLLETKGLKRKLLDAVEKLTYSLSSKVYPNSFGLEAIIQEQDYADKNKIKVIGKGSSNGINTTFFSREQVSNAVLQQTKDENSIVIEDFVFIFIGRIVNDKGITELVSAFENLATNYQNAKLILVGNFEEDLDPLDSKTHSLIDNHPNIKFVGYHQDVRPMLAASNVLVFPSYREGLPNVPLQACAMDLPCIVSDINGCNEIITHEFNGLLVPVKNTIELQNAMERIMVDKALYDKLSGNARESILTRYDQQVLWKEIKKEYDAQLELAGIFNYPVVN